MSKRAAEGVPVQELGQKDHGRDVGIVGPHSAHGERDDRRVSGDGNELADHAIQRPMQVDDRLARRLRRWMAVQGVARVHAVPQSFDRAVDFAGDRDEEVPVREPLGREPSRRLRADGERAGQTFAHRSGARRGGPGKPVRPLGRRVAAEPAAELRQETGRSPGHDDSRIVSAPPHDAPSRRRAVQVRVWRVEHDDAAVEAGPPWRESRAFLPRFVCRRIEFHGGPPASRLRRESGGDVLPRESRALRRTVVEPETGGASAQRGKRRHLALGHEPLGQAELQPVEAHGQNPGTRHRDQCSARRERCG